MVVRSVLLLGLGSFGFVSCGERDCTDIGCRDQLSFEVRPRQGVWADGAYELRFSVDQVSHVCAFQAPDDFPKDGSYGSISCDDGKSSLGVLQDSECVEQHSRDAVGLACTPIPDHYTLTASFSGTPTALSLALRRDDVLLAESVSMPMYTSFTPNGKGCGPVCRQAQVELEFD